MPRKKVNSTKKTHLVGGVATTKCGRKLKNVCYVIDINLVTCLKCKK